VCPYTAVFCPPRRDRTKRSQCRETEKVPPRARERERDSEGNGGWEKGGRISQQDACTIAALLSVPEDFHPRQFVAGNVPDDLSKVSFSFP
jgi:hypothetical protein